MNKYKNITLAIIAGAFLFSGTAMAADVTIKTPDVPQQPVVNTPKAPDIQKPDLAGTLKSKANEAVDTAQQKFDSAADKLKQSLGNKKDQITDTASTAVNKNATNVKSQADKAKNEILDVTQETVTVETPTGAAQETTTTITPEKLAPAAKQAK